MTRRTATRSFYEMRNLCSRRVISLELDGQYGMTTVAAGLPSQSLELYYYYFLYTLLISLRFVKVMGESDALLYEIRRT